MLEERGGEELPHLAGRQLWEIKSQHLVTSCFILFPLHCPGPSAVLDKLGSEAETCMMVSLQRLLDQILHGEFSKPSVVVLPPSAYLGLAKLLLYSGG